MLHRRLRRLTTMCFMVMSLLFAQLALASYVCPQQADVEVMASMMEAGVPCNGMDQEQPALCHQHAADPGKTSETVKAPAVSLPLLVQVLVLPAVLDAAASRSLPVAEMPEARPPPDPLFLSTLRLRV